MQNTRPIVVWDLVLSIVLLLAVLATTAIVLMFGLMGAMMASACGPGCDLEQFGVGFALSLTLPVLCALATVIVTIVFLVKRRRTFWVPLAGIGLVVIAWLSGTAVLAASMPQLFAHGIGIGIGIG